MLEFHLGRVTTNNQEADFERFSRKLCEREICPNLLPATGPMGGGDSKADSETFPVAEKLALAWYSGVQKEAAQQRWAFAFSAMADWEAKVKSDVEKIAATGRGYEKAFYVTNQSVRAKRRAELEDSLTKKYGMEVRILDGNWIAERVFAGRHQDLAIEELNITALRRRERQTGPTDSARKSQLEALEKRIADALQQETVTAGIVDDALEVALICRSLELPRTQTEGAFGRAQHLASKYGSIRQKVEVTYQRAWTRFWWFDDSDGLVELYTEIEALAKDSENGYDVERLSNLWTLLHGRIAADKDDPDYDAWLDERTTILSSVLERLEQDTGRPSTALQARSHRLMMELQISLLAGEDPALPLDGLRGVVEESTGLIGFPFQTLAQLVEVIGDLVDDHPSFGPLFDATVEASSRHDGEVRAATMLLKRGEQLISQDKPAKAIATVGQALTRLYKHETRHEIVFALILCANAYQEVGLLWAARGTYLSAASISADEFWRYDEITPAFAASVDRLRWVELRLGRIPQVLAWHSLGLALRNALEAKGCDTSFLAQGDIDFDALLSRLFIRTPYGQLEEMRSLPDALEGMLLFASSASLLFLLGHTGEIENLAKDGEGPDGIANRIWHLTADAPLPSEPVIYGDERIQLTSKILGCHVSVDCSPVDPCVEVAESILAALESFLATSALGDAIATEPTFTLAVDVGNTGEEFVSFQSEERLGRPHFVVSCRAFDPHDLLLAEQLRVREEIFQAALAALTGFIRIEDLQVQALFSDERVAERASAFTGSIGTVRNVLGKDPDLHIAQWKHPEAREYEVVRGSPWLPEEDSEQGEHRAGSEANAEGAPEAFKPEAVRHDQMNLVSPIRGRLWDRVGWVGALYVTTEGHQAPPVMGLVFKNKEAARDIFQGWVEDFGRSDEERALRITVIRGIDQDAPHAYRILIGTNLEPKGPKGAVVLMLQRVHRMDATDPANLQRFINGFMKHGRFVLVPAYLNIEGPEPDFELALGVYELNVREAWEIGLNDLDGAGVNEDDKVIVPDGIPNPPVYELQAWKRAKKRGPIS
jgi:hypothetical protein